MHITPQATINGAGEDARGNVLMDGLWDQGTGCILDTRVTDTDSKLYENFSSSKVMEKGVKVKKDKYPAPCLARRRSLMPVI